MFAVGDRVQTIVAVEGYSEKLMGVVYQVLPGGMYRLCRPGTEERPEVFEVLWHETELKLPDEE